MPTKPRSRCGRTRASCLGPTWAGRKRRNGTSRSRTSTTSTRPSTRPGTASRRSGASMRTGTGPSSPPGSVRPRWRRPHRAFPESSCRWRSWGGWMAAKRRHRRSTPRRAVSELDRGAAARGRERFVAGFAAGHSRARARRRDGGGRPHGQRRGPAGRGCRSAGRLPGREPGGGARSAPAARRLDRARGPHWRAVPARVRAAEPAWPRRSARPAPRDGRPAVLPDRRQKERGVPGLAAVAMVLRRLRHPGDDGLAGGVSVFMRLHVATADARPARARGGAGLRARDGAVRDRRALRLVAVRDRPVGGEGGHAEHPGPEGRRAARTRRGRR